MPVDYSKWDALELSDDSDIEVHPNVDKRSFIRAKQNQIHQERQQRKHQIETLNKSLDERGLADNRYQGMIDGIGEHLGKVEGLQAQLLVKLAELEKEEGRKITSEGYKDGFNSSHIAKAAPGEAKDGKKQEVELLNPNFQGAGGAPSASTESYGDDEEIEASPAAQLFAQIRANDYAASLSFLSKHPEILTERETDGLLVMAFDAALERKDDWSRQCVHQALLLQYCRALGKDGVAMFFKRITTKGHQAQEVFYKDVTDTYARIRTRAREIVAERAKEPAEGVEQIQLHAVEPGTEIKIRIPPADSEEVEVKEARLIFESFSDEFRKALETGSLDKVNHVLGNMTVEAAEDVVAKLGDAGILSLEEQIIDATTEEGRKALKEMEAAQTGTGAGSESGYAPDPE
ncbi:hypothetical protein VdG1_04409 [Verticillium dahliae VDG1]|nr:hypothetical protein VdG1_04409 [Verticillium dahliae VDG1]